MSAFVITFAFFFFFFFQAEDGIRDVAVTGVQTCALPISSRRTAAAAVVPTFGERRGHPVIWDHVLFAELDSCSDATRHGARAVLHAHDDWIHSVSADDPAVINDLKPPADYERLVREGNRDIY